MAALFAILTTILFGSEAYILMYSQKLHRSTQTILSRILQLLIFFVLVPLAVLLIVYNLSTQNALKEEVFQTHVQTLETKSNSIEKMIDQMLSAVS